MPHRQASGFARSGAIAGIAIAISLVSRTGSAQGTADPRFGRIAEVVTQRMKQYGVPGAALGISFEGRRVTRGFGVTSVENPLPVTPSTLFQAGSIGKTFTGTAVMRLVDEGKLRLDAPVRDYLPEFRVHDEVASRRATVRTLLTHMGGWEGDLFEDPGNGDDALAALVARMATLEQIAPFDTLWSYNNAGFCVAGRLIEVATGKPYETALRDLVIAPLGMRQAFTSPSDVMTHRFAVGHAGLAAAPIVLRPWQMPRALNPAGGVVASVDDLLRYAEFHLGDGVTPDGARLVSQASMRLMHETQFAKQGTDEEMGIAWQVTKAGPLRELWHDGAAVGQMALMLFVPERRFAAVVLTNSVAGERLNRDIRRAVELEYLGVTVRDPSPIAVPEAKLARYAGRYSRPFMDVVVTVDADRLMLQLVQKQGFPVPTSFVPPPGRSVAYRFYARDRLVESGLEPGGRAEFLRGPDGTVGWIRVGGRIARRVAVD